VCLCGHLKKIVFMKRVGRDASQYGNRMIGEVSEAKDIIPVHEMFCDLRQEIRSPKETVWFIYCFLLPQSY